MALMIAARGPVIFGEEQLARIERVQDHGGWLNRDEFELPPATSSGRAPRRSAYRPLPRSGNHSSGESPRTSTYGSWV